MASPRGSDALIVDPTPVLVWGRAVVLGAAILASGTVSHVLGAGHLPGPLAMTSLWLTCAVLVSGLLRVRASSTRLVLLLVGGQTFVHTALSVLAGHRGDPVTQALPDAGGPSTGGAASGPAAMGVSQQAPPERYFDHYQALSAASPAPAGGEDWLAHQVEHVTAQGPMMVGAHVLGAVAVALFLAVGERALWRMLLLAQTRVRLHARLWALVTCGHLARSGVVRAASLIGHPTLRILRPALLDRRVQHHRGPPFVLAA